jgi:hypothetical protein
MASNYTIGCLLSGIFSESLWLRARGGAAHAVLKKVWCVCPAAAGRAAREDLSARTDRNDAGIVRNESLNP